MRRAQRGDFHLQQGQLLRDAALRRKPAERPIGSQDSVARDHNRQRVASHRRAGRADRFRVPARPGQVGVRGNASIGDPAAGLERALMKRRTISKVHRDGKFCGLALKIARDLAAEVGQQILRRDSLGVARTDRGFGLFSRRRKQRSHQRPGTSDVSEISPIRWNEIVCKHALPPSPDDPRAALSRGTFLYAKRATAARMEKRWAGPFNPRRSVGNGCHWRLVHHWFPVVAVKCWQGLKDPGDAAG